MVEAKQVKVDNWGIFFLQRLQQFYDKAFFCDLTLQFEDNVEIKVHRLVMNACTEYFQMLENTCIIEKDIIMMPSNLPSDVVIPIINFMYSGILEFHDSLFDRLYATAKLMNMSVLTKLLDAQKNPIQPIKPITKKVQSVTPITWNLQGKKIMTKNVIDSELPETLPGRKLPIWKRKCAPITHPYIPTGIGYEALNSKPFIKSSIEEAPKPTRFEWPDEDSTFENSFDEISYTSKPIILPSLSKESASKPSTSNSTFDEIKRSGSMKRSASPVGNQCKKVNIQDVKEYLKEHKIRSDYIDYDDSETTDNDLQTYDNADDHDSNEEGSKDGADIFTNQQPTEDTPSKGILKTDKSESSSPNKHVRFSLDGKENTANKQTVKVQTTSTAATPDVSNHTKIITEVLKKYPHLVKKNKNIRLKILAKGTSPVSTPGKVTTTVTASPKPAAKVQYMVMKSETSKTAVPSTSDKKLVNEQEPGPWLCKKCEPIIEFSSYHAYRQHLTEVHNEKIDSQMCNICGQVCRKQNMLVYHKYTKHNIAPPAMYNFPKCKECSYIAISPTLLSKHIQQHCNRGNQQGHVVTENKLLPQWGCQFCDKAFFSENILLTHQKRSHDIEIREEFTKEDTKEINTNKEKIKILSDIKVNTGLPPGTTLIPVRQIGDIRKQENVTSHEVPEPLEPSSEAEALSNVASGIAASLGLVDTIVVLDDNQFIIQSTQGNLQQNVINNSGQDYIIPDMQMPDLTSIATTSIDPNQTPVVTLSSDTNTVLTQSLNKSEIATTDELVMVLTDHDYSDATNQAVISGDNNIVVLYSHPVQTQATMMINSETGMLEVDKNYQEAADMSTEQQTEESIEMIQQEINNHLETDMVHQQQHQQEQVQLQEYNQENMIEEQDNTYRVCSESVARILQENQHIQQGQLQQAILVDSEEQPMVEESIQMIQDEINNIPQETETMDTIDDTEKPEIHQQYQQMEIDEQNQQENIITNESEMQLRNDEDTTQTEIENQNLANLNPEQNISEIENVEYIQVTQEYEDKQNDNLRDQEYETEKVEYETEKGEYETEKVEYETEKGEYETEKGEYESEKGEYVLEKGEYETEKGNNGSEKGNDESQKGEYVSEKEEYISEMNNDSAEVNVNEDSQKLQQNTCIDLESEQETVAQDETPLTEEIARDKDQIEDSSEVNEEMQMDTHETIELQIEEEKSTEFLEKNETMENIPEEVENNMQIITDTKTGQIENVSEENMEVITESSKILDSTEELLEDTQKMLETAKETQEENENQNTNTQDENPQNQDMEINQLDSNQPASEPMQEISEPMEISDNQDSVPLQKETLIETSEVIQEDSENQNLPPQDKEKSELEQKSIQENIEPIQNEGEEFAIEKISEQSSKTEPVTSTQNPKSPDNIDEEENIVEAIKSEVKKEIIKKAEKKKLTAISTIQAKEKISKILDDWDDADTDSPQSNSKTNNGSSINKLIDDWEDEEDT